MNKLLIATALLTSLWIPPQLWAQAPPSTTQGPITVTLTNGDRLTGILRPSDRSGLRLDSESLGTLRFAWTSVASWEMSDDVRVARGSTSSVTGRAILQSGALLVHTAGGDVTVPLAELTWLEWINQPPPGRMDKTKVVVEDNLNLKRGNTETLTTTVNGSVTLQGDSVGFSGYALRSYSSTGSGDDTRTTGDTGQAGGRLDKYFGRQSFVFASTDVKNDRFQQVLRIWGTGGFGHDLVSDESTVFSLMLGFSQGRDALRLVPTQSVVPNLELEGWRTYHQAQASEALRHRFRNGVQLSEDLVTYRQLGTASFHVGRVGRQGVTGAIPATGLVRSEFTGQLIVPVRRHLSWQAQVQHSYTNHPYPGSKSTDVSLVSGFSLNFGNSSLGGYSGSSSNVGSLAGSGAVKSATQSR